MTARSSLRWRRIVQGFVVVCATLLAACSSTDTTTRPLLALLFDIPPPGQDTGHAPVIRSPRRTIFVDPGIEEAKKYLASLEARAKAPPPANWAEMYQRLPKDDDDNIAWMLALTDKVITPSAGIDPATPQPEVLDEDVELSTSGKPARMVVFSHQVHTSWLRCNNCHPAIFEKEAGSAKITMEAIDDGKFCGVCHDKVAIAPDGCKGCHKTVKKS